MIELRNFLTHLILTLLELEDRPNLDRESFLSKIKSWSMDNTKHELVLE